MQPEIGLRLPAWLEELMAEAGGRRYAPGEERMRLAIGLARRNVEQGTGGPFGAALFEAQEGWLAAAGVNLVVTAGCSLLHAETVALLLAQRRLGSFDLGGDGLPALELVTSSEPCVMCFGAVLWSGVRRLVCGARGEDAEGVGFDEGPKPADWVGELERRGIAVARDVCREEAAEVLRRYGQGGGVIYNPCRGR